MSDQRDTEILTARMAARATIDGARVGDWVRMPDGEMRRFTHDWGDGLQISTPQFGFGSFYFSRDGSMSYSGGLDPCVPRERLRDTGEILDGAVWFFHHDRATAHNGVYVNVPCRVFELDAI